MAEAPNNPRTPAAPTASGAETLAGPPARTGSRASGGVEDIVSQIRAELADISAYELDLRRREQEFSAEQRRMEEAARVAARAEAEILRTQLARQKAALAARATELVEERKRIEARAVEVHQAAQRVQSRQIELARRTEHVKRRVESLAGRFRRDRERLRRRIALVRTREADLNRRIRLARDEIVQEREALSRRGAELDAQAGRLVEQEQSLALRRAELERWLASATVQAADARERLNTFETERRRLSDEHQAVARAAGDVEARRSALDTRQRELESRAAELAARSEQLEAEHTRLAQELDELEARRSALDRQRGELAELVTRAERREQALTAQATALEAQREQIQAASAALARRQEAIDAAQHRADEIEQQARQALDEARALREQTESRDANSRHAAMAIETERQALEQRSAALQALEARFDQLQVEREQAAEQARKLILEWSARVRQADHGWTAAPGAGWRRVAGLSALAGVVAALAWLWTNPVHYESRTALRVATERGEDVSLAAAPATTTDDNTVTTAESERWFARVRAEHVRGLLDPDLLATAAAPPELAAAWRSASAGVGGPTEVRVEAGPGPLDLVLRVSSRWAARASELGRAAAAAYAERVNAIAAAPSLPEHYAELDGWRQALERQIAQARAARDADVAAMMSLPGPEHRDAEAARLESTRQELTAVSAGLEEQRAALAALLSAEVPAIVVDPLDVENALAEDEIYAQDVVELTATAARYRDELHTAMVLMAEPLETLDRRLAALTATIQEQSNLSPPETVTPVLSACGEIAARLVEQSASLGEQWRVWLEAVQSHRVSADRLEASVRELAEQQQQAAETAGRFGAEAGRRAAEIGRQIESLAERGAGSTRELVVATVLRSDYRALRAAIEGISAAAARCAPAANVELDAHDRQIRGLRTRIGQRREVVAQRLELEAAQAARARHAASAEQARLDVRQLEQRREALVAEALDRLHGLRRLDEDVRRREALAARVAQADAALADLTTRLGEVESHLASIRRQGPQPDRVEIIDTTTAAVTAGRGTRALAAGTIAAAATWLLYGLLLARNPWRGDPRREVERLLSAGPPAT